MPPPALRGRIAETDQLAFAFDDTHALVESEWPVLA
jgi:hypothetical protein